MKTPICTLIEIEKKIFKPSFAKIVFFAFIFISLTQTAGAASGITYSGRIVKGSTPVDTGTVRFDVWIKTKDSCVLYYERRDLDMTGTNGTYSFEIGSAGAISPAFGHASITSLSDVFDNTKTFANGALSGGGSCGAFSPAADEGRLMSVTFTPAGDTAQALPDLTLTAVPSAFQAFNANKLNGYDQNHLLRIDPAIASPVNSDLNATQLAEFFRLVNNPTSAYLSSIPTLGGDVSGTLGAMSVDKIKGYAVATPAGAADNGKVLTFNSVTGWSLQVGSSPGDSSYSAKGIVQFDTDAATSGMIVASGLAKVNVGTSAGQIVQVQTGGKLPALDGSLLTNLTLGNNSVGSAQITDGSVASADIASLAWSKITGTPTTLSGYGITDAVKNNGATPGISAGNDAAKPGTPTSGELYVAVDTGKIYRWDGSASWDVVATKSGSVLNTAPLASAKVWVGNASGVASEVLLSGDVAISNVGLVTATKTTTAEANKLLSLDGSSIGTMSGVALVNTGTVTLSAATNSATYGLKFPAAAPAASQVLQSDASGNLSWITALTSSTGWVNGGNSFGAISSIGNNDNFNLDVKTNNATRMTVTAGGNVGIGVTAPSQILSFDGTAGRTIWMERNTTAASNGSDLTIEAGGATVGGASKTGGNLYLKSGVSTGAPATKPAINLQINGGGGGGTLDGTHYTVASFSGWGWNANTANSSLTMNSDSNISYDRLAYIKFVRTNYDPTGTAAQISLYREANGTSGQLRFSTNAGGAVGQAATDRMTILSNGNVGIGTTAPGYPLSVVGALSNSSTMPFNQVLLDSAGVAANVGGGIAFGGNYSAGISGTFAGIRGGKSNSTSGDYAGYLAMYTRANASNPEEHMRILSDGKVGIGTTLPTALLQVSGPSADGTGVGLFRAESDSGADNVGVKIGVLAGAGSNGYGYIQGVHTGVANDANLILNPVDGKVGIGTISPTATLEVKGHLGNSGNSATLGACGTGAAITGNDTRGYVTIGTGTTTSCEVTFNSAFATAPYCTITWRGSASTIGVGVTSATTTLTVNFSAAADSLSFNYLCMQ